MSDKRTVVIFGGAGFVGKHYASYLLKNNRADKIYLADLVPPDGYMPDELQTGLKSKKVEFNEVDVRKNIGDQDLNLQEVDLACNFAAVHREAGNEKEDYFKTNVTGAQNVTRWAETVGCKRIVFTSSIAPYGPSEKFRDETSLPMPETPYGISKLVAEKIHQSWGCKERERKLLVVRPGVVFGPGEGGNVTRLVKGVLGGYFIYLGNQQTKKAGGYVKDLCRLFEFGLKELESENKGHILYNFTYDPPPAIQDYVRAVREVGNVNRWIPSLPQSLPVVAAYVIDAFASVFRIDHPFKPARVKKSLRSNNIGTRLTNNPDFNFHFDLEKAFKDWREEYPADWQANMKDSD